MVMSVRVSCDSDRCLRFEAATSKTGEGGTLLDTLGLPQAL